MIKTHFLLIACLLICTMSLSNLWAESSVRIPRMNKDACDCATFQISCMDDQQLAISCGSATTAACARDCDIIINQAVCDSHDLKTGSYSFDQFNDRLGCDMENIAMQVQALDKQASDYEEKTKKLVKEINYCSILTHEAFHSCVSKQLAKQGAHRTLACNEWGGMTISYTMYAKAMDSLCEQDKKNNPPGNPSLFCKYLCGDLFSTFLYVDWLECTCKASENISGGPFNSEWLSRSECCACNKRCIDSQSSLKNYTKNDFCQREVFGLKEFQDQVLPLVNDRCNEIAFSPAHYSCNKFSNKKYDYQNGCE